MIDTIETNHTPGPWYVGAQNGGLHVIDRAPSPAPYDATIPAASGPNVVATPNWRLPGYGANARLIAAAPDLLEALQLLEREMVLSGNAGSEDYGWKPAIKKTREALAKALPPMGTESGGRA